ncbi:hypothetical protein RHMOL_Rhmol07G0162700 [Rhododendron molle]|uniref:Uncharacterized protein n=1 Tax=Rhododendron molle TaxID=49168 RepID=A0ACC0N165_RHOML|nr:hypothetical protein RHMOL_Rhmol07G0162700 [Rhododendron molle]
MKRRKTEKQSVSEDEEEEDLSMVLDASSGPWIFHEECFGNAGYGFFCHAALDAALPKNRGKRETYPRLSDCGLAVLRPLTTNSVKLKEQWLKRASEAKNGNLAQKAAEVTRQMLAKKVLAAWPILFSSSLHGPLSKLFKASPLIGLSAEPLSTKQPVRRLIGEPSQAESEKEYKLKSILQRIGFLISFAIACNYYEGPTCQHVILLLPRPDEVRCLSAKTLVHPVIRSDSQGKSTVVPNDVTIGGSDHTSFILLIGPNMGGKSTLLRQVCWAVILDQNEGDQDLLRTALVCEVQICVYKEVRTDSHGNPKSE